MTVRFGVLGAGRIGRVHARAVASVAGAELVAVADPVAEAARHVADAFGCEVRTVDGIEGSDDIDAAIASGDRASFPASPKRKRTRHHGRALEATVRNARR